MIVLKDDDMKYSTKDSLDRTTRILKYYDGRDYLLKSTHMYF